MKAPTNTHGDDETRGVLQRLRRFSPGWFVMAAVLFGVAARLAVLQLFPHLSMYGDEFYYLLGAQQLAAGEEVAYFPFRAPLYIFFSAAVLQFIDASRSAVLVAQALLEGLTILGVAILARRLFDRRAAAVAAWMTALYPDFIAYSHCLFSETLFLFLLVYGLLGLQSLFARPSIDAAVVVGILWGLLTLIKPFHIYLLPLILLWFVVEGGAPDRRRRVLLALGSLLLVLGVTLPWSIHISQREGDVIFVCTTGRANLKSGTNYFEPPQFDYPLTYVPPRDERKRLGRKEGLVTFIVSNPVLVARRTVDKMVRLWTPNSFLVRHVYVGKYGDPKRMHAFLRVGVIITAIASTVALLVLGVLGLGVVGRKPARNRFVLGVTALYCVPYLGMVALTPSQSRYRLPLMIFAILFAAAFVTWRDGRRSSLRDPRIATGCGVALVLLCIFWWMSLADLVPAIW